MHVKAPSPHSAELDSAQSPNGVIAAMLQAKEALHNRSSGFGLISTNDHQGDAVSGGMPRPDETESDMGITATKFACRPHSSRKLARSSRVATAWAAGVDCRSRPSQRTEVVRGCEGAERVVSILLALVKVLIDAQGALLNAAIETGVLLFILSLRNYLSSCFRSIWRKVLHAKMISGSRGTPCRRPSKVSERASTSCNAVTGLSAL
jgi:hypothetical protein